MGYIDCEYKGSINYNSVMSIRTKENLLFRMSFTEGAIKYHTDNNNVGQVKFFSDELKHIQKRLKSKAISGAPKGWEQVND